MTRTTGPMKNDGQPDTDWGEPHHARREVPAPRTARSSREAIVRAMTWLASAVIAWSLVAWIDELRSGGTDPRDMATSVAVSTVLSLVAALPVAVFHGLALALARSTPRWAAWLSLAVAASVGWPALRAAEFLVSGAWIARQWFAPALAVLFFVTALLAAVGVFWVHALLTEDLRTRLADRVWARRFAQPARIRWLAAAAAVAGAVLVVAASRFGATYAPLARFILPAAWLLCASALAFLGSHRPKVAQPVLASGLVASSVVTVSWLLVLQAPAAGIVNTLVMESLALADERVPRIRLDVPAVRCGEQPSQAAPSYAVPMELRRNVILVSIDALRADVPGTKGENGSPITPNLDRFASHARTFASAQTTYPATALALASAMTGRYPSRVLLALEPPTSMLARLAGAFAQVYVSLPADAWFDLPAIAELITQGVRCERIAGAPAQTQGALDALRHFRSRGERAFVWVHYYEPHPPYVAHPTMPRGAGRRGAYLSEVSFVDAALAELLTELDRGGWYRDSLVVVFADHGQSLGERGYWGHHVHLTRTIGAIPLYLRAPGVERGVETAPVSLVDLAPTVLEFAGLEPLDDTDGVSLLGPADPARHVFLEAFPLRGEALFRFVERKYRALEVLPEKLAIVNDNVGGYAPKVAIVGEGHRLVVNRATGARELFDDVADPTNEHPVEAGRSGRAAKLFDDLAEWHEEQSRKIVCAMQADGTR